MAKSQFDPSELETEELLTPETTDKDAFNDDTLADPEGAEAREPQNRGTLYPTYLYRDYKVGENDALVPNQSAIDAVMAIFEEKAETPVAEGKEKQFAKDLKTVVAGRKPLLAVDAPSSGIQCLREMTNAWSEFASLVYDYVNSSQSISKEDQMPDWLLQREAKMVDMGYKARLLRDANSELFSDYNLPGKFELNRTRVRQSIESRFERLAAWHTSQHRESTAGDKMQKASSEFAQSIADNA
tara:strand:- start:29505 stop:30230 length:726 start_codon:yes stop_codon:yes gene_type:complete